MASNSGSRRKQRQLSNTNSGAHKTNLELTGEEFWKLTSLQQEITIEELKIEMSEKDKREHMLSRRIHDLQMTLVDTKISYLRQKKNNKRKNLESYRSTLAEKLGLKSLDEYVVDDETYILMHENEITGKV